MTDPNAVRLLGHIGGDEAIHCILDDAVKRPRIDTAIVVAALLDAGPRAVDQLVALSSIGLGRHGDDRSPQVYAARGLLTSVARARLDLLTPYLHTHDDAGYRVADAIGESHASGARAALEASLSDPDPVMRRVVASALGTLGERAAIPALRARGHDDDEWVRQSVDSALEKLEAIP
jgi:hypothetical protein